MDTKTNDMQMETAFEAFFSKPDLVTDYAWGLTPPPSRKSLWSDPEAVRSLERTKESLIFAYLGANMSFKNIPLKEFLDDFEKKILLACLRMTHGHQKDAATLLGVKPTALFEKMRKHGINGRRKKLSEKLEAPQHQALE
jgi:DNA-binding NtrC family response regulator